MAAYNLFEKLVVEVLFSGKYNFHKTLGPIVKKLEIIDFTFLSPITYLIKFILLGCFFYQALADSTFKKVLKYIIYGLVIFELIQIFVFKSYLGYSSLSSTVKNIYYLLLPSVLLFRIYRHPAQNVLLHKNIFVWICVGILLPTLSHLFLELIFTKLHDTDESGFYGNYIFRNSSEMVLAILLVVATWQTKYIRFIPKQY